MLDRKSGTMNGNQSMGSSTVEFLVSLAFFVPVFIAVPMIGKYIDFKQKNIEANRYAVWERTVWAGPQGRWNDNENTKTEDQIATEIDQRFYGSQMQGMASKKITENKLWVDGTGKKMLALAPKGKKRITVTVGENVSPVKNRPIDAFAYSGVPLVGSAMDSITQVSNASLGRFISDCKNLPGVDFKRGMNLGSRTYSSINITSSVKNFATATNDPDPKNSTLTFNSGGTILSNAWTAPTEAMYKQRVGKLVLDDAVRCLAVPARLVSIIPFYKEGKAAKNVESAAKTTVLLSTYKK